MYTNHQEIQVCFVVTKVLFLLVIYMFSERTISKLCLSVLNQDYYIFSGILHFQLQRVKHGAFVSFLPQGRKNPFLGGGVQHSIEQINGRNRVKQTLPPVIPLFKRSSQRKEHIAVSHLVWCLDKVRLERVVTTFQSRFICYLHFSGSRNLALSNKCQNI